MRKRVYDFADQYQAQQLYFSRFIAWYQRQYNPDLLTLATEEQEKQSIDLVATTDGHSLTIEVKTEFAANKTGNLVFEVVSQARIGDNGVLGWGFKLEKTDVIAYLVPGPDKIYAFEPVELQAFVLENYSRLRNFTAKNKGYTTLGVLMPINLVAQVAHIIGDLGNILDGMGED